jgi:hypothetical protein
MPRERRFISSSQVIVSATREEPRRTIAMPTSKATSRHRAHRRRRRRTASRPRRVGHAQARPGPVHDQERDRDRETSRGTRSGTRRAPRASPTSRGAWTGGSGRSASLWRIDSSSSGRAGGRRAAACRGDRPARLGRIGRRADRANVISSRPCSARQPIRYSTPSMTPHARLQPSAPISIVRMSSRPASAMLNEPVNVSTMIRPKSTSAMRSCGSSTRLEGWGGGRPVMRGRGGASPCVLHGSIRGSKEGLGARSRGA